MVAKYLTPLLALVSLAAHPQVATLDLNEHTLGKHPNTRITGTGVLDGGLRGAAYTLTFRTNDLPEAKNLYIMVWLNQPPNPAQQVSLKNPRIPKTIVVTCQTVNVLQASNSRPGHTMNMAQGNHCTLDSLQDAQTR